MEQRQSTAFRRSHVRHRLGAFWLLACLVLLPLTARADLTITPIRIVFEGRSRSATVELINQTNRTNTYRLQWLEMKMGKSGRYELVPVDENNPNSVAKMVLFTPRQVTIAPHGYQTIRLSLRRPADLPPGEYRAHMAMVRLAKQGPERPDPNAKDVSMELRVNLGFSIPVIVRSGEDKELKIDLTSPKLEALPGKTPTAPPKPVLGIDIERVAGKFSSFGTITVFWDPASGPEKQIGAVSNMALYPEVQKRHVTISLREAPTDGAIRVVYKGKYESEGKIWADKTFPVR